MNFVASTFRFGRSSVNITRSLLCGSFFSSHTFTAFLAIVNVLTVRKKSKTVSRWAPLPAPHSSAMLNRNPRCVPPSWWTVEALLFIIILDVIYTAEVVHGPARWAPEYLMDNYVSVIFIVHHCNAKSSIKGLDGLWLTGQQLKTSNHLQSLLLVMASEVKSYFWIYCITLVGSRVNKSQQ